MLTRKAMGTIAEGASKVFCGIVDVEVKEGVGKEQVGGENSLLLAPVLIWICSSFLNHSLALFGQGVG